MNRRTLLAAVSGGALGLAGCLGERAPDEGGDDSDGDSHNNPSLETSVVTRSASCGGPDDDWAMAVDEGSSLRIDGTSPAPNPCHAAEIGQVSLQDNRLTISVDVESTLGDDEDCAQCHGAIDYTVDVSTGDAEIQEVQIIHEQGETHNVEPYKEGDEMELRDTDIETVDTACVSGEDDTVSITRTGERVLLEGVLPAPNPCHLATIARAVVSEGQLSVEIGVQTDSRDGDVCVECVGRVEYLAAFHLEAAHLLERVSVAHENGGSHTVQWDEATEGN